MIPNEPTPNRTRWPLILLGSCLAMLILLLICSIALLGGALFFQDDLAQLAETSPIEASAETLPLPSATATLPALHTRLPENETVQNVQPLPTATVTLPTVEATAKPTAEPTAEPTATPLPFTAPEGIDQRPIPARSATDLQRMLDTTQPGYDYYDAALNLGRYDIGPRTITRPERFIGEQATFDTDGNTVSAELMVKTSNLYFWVEDGLSLDTAELQASAEEIEQHLPLLRAVFGQDWQPGIDGDPHISVLHLIGSANTYELGYFTDKDEYPRTLFTDSNEQEIIYLNMSQLDVGEALYIGTVVHELQHLIQWNMDRNETIWLNEGLSQLAELTIGLQTATTEDFLLQPEIRLNAWEYEEDVIDAHYAASYLFAVYFWEQLGDQAIQELSRHPNNDMASVSAVLHAYAPQRSLTQFMGDWAVANALDAPTENPAYGYVKLDIDAPVLYDAISERPFEALYSAEPFTTTYIDLNVTGPTTLTFVGDTVTKVADFQPSSGEQIWFAPGVDDSHNTLTRRFDLTTLSDATLSFNAWYDIEQDYDFIYLTASTDNGATWNMLTPPNAISGDYGPGLNGQSSSLPDAVGGWVRESVSLAAYAGQDVLIRFHTLMDFEESGQGVGLDDIAIPEIGFFSDVEGDADGWDAQGFVQTGVVLPQQWVVRIIRNDPPIEIIDLPLNSFNQARQTIDLGSSGGTLIVMPTTPFISEPAAFWLQIE